MPRIRAYKVSCDQCQMLSINGIACHEIGCPNMGSRWHRIDLRWIKQRECFDCGYTVDADDPCCSAPIEEPQRDPNCLLCVVGFSCEEHGF